MRTTVITCVAWMLLTTCAFAQERHKSAVLLIDGQNNHDWPRATAILKVILEDSGLFTVDVSTTPPKGAPAEAWNGWRPDFRKYAVVVSNFNGGHQDNATRWPHEVEESFEQYIRNGGGFVSFHAANNAFLNWPAYNEMIGLGWRTPDFGPSILISPDEKIVTIPKGRGPQARSRPRARLCHDDARCGAPHHEGAAEAVAASQ
jgi:hypothetical protein